MTTELDHGGSTVERLVCEERSTNLYPTLVLALKDMRKANARDEATGDGVGNESWIALSLGMIVLDTLSGRGKVRTRFERLLKRHGLTAEDATILYALRCSLLHGYGIPKPKDACGRSVVLTREQYAPAVDTSRSGFARISVPVFCRSLVERIVSEAPEDWDVGLIDIHSSL